MNHIQKNLWDKIRSFELDDPGLAFSFTDRLVRENGWTYAYANAVILEYKRFIFLICTTEESLTPSDQVDQVWHLHLIYTHSYWVDFCEHTLGRKIHHGPTKGGDSERTKYDNLYSRTLEKYKEVFDIKPPEDIWPTNKKRFEEINFRRINLNNYWVIKKPLILKKIK